MAVDWLARLVEVTTPTVDRPLTRGGLTFDLVTGGDPSPNAGTDPTPTIWIASDGNDTTGTGSSATPWRTFAKAFSVMSAGGVLGVKDGTYTDSITSLPVGQAGNECHVVSETDGGVVITGGLALSTQSNWYCTWRGSLFSNAVQKSIIGKYASFLRCGFRGAEDTGNVSTLVVGTGDATPGAEHILLEDVWAFGPGGRYKILVYNAANILLRRCVVRHDSGWSWDGSNPQAGISLYNSHVWAIQPLVIDTDPSSVSMTFGHEAELYMPYNTDATNYNPQVLGGFVIQARSSGYKTDGANPTGVTTNVVHSVVHSSAVTAYGVVNNVASSAMVANRCTVIGGIDGYAAYQPAGTMNVTGSLVEDASGSALNGATDGGLNRAWNCGDLNGVTELDPEANGLTYPARIESGSTLAAIPCGANLVNRVGVSGTRLGESGWITITSDPLWPWPNQDLIKTQMSEVSDRGFCASDQSLTRYVMNLLGNGSPY